MFFGRDPTRVSIFGTDVLSETTRVLKSTTDVLSETTRVIQSMTIKRGQKSHETAQGRKEIEASYERNALELRKPDKAILRQLKAAADNTFKKDRRINIRLSEHDIVGIQKVAANRGIPYQSLISVLIHQFVEGDLVEKATS